MNADHPCSTYLLLIQPNGGKARIEFYSNTDANPTQRPQVIFEGGRCQAKRLLKSKTLEVGFEGVPQYNQPKTKNGRVPALRQSYAPYST